MKAAILPIVSLAVPYWTLGNSFNHPFIICAYLRPISLPSPTLCYRDFAIVRLDGKIAIAHARHYSCASIHSASLVSIYASLQTRSTDLTEDDPTAPVQRGNWIKHLRVCVFVNTHYH
jgi:hypothetical protein